MNLERAAPPVAAEQLVLAVGRRAGVLRPISVSSTTLPPELLECVNDGIERGLFSFAPSYHERPQRKEAWIVVAIFRGGLAFARCFPLQQEADLALRRGFTLSEAVDRLFMTSRTQKKRDDIGKLLFKCWFERGPFAGSRVYHAAVTEVTLL